MKNCKNIENKIKNFLKNALEALELGKPLTYECSW